MRRAGHIQTFYQGLSLKRKLLSAALLFSLLSALLFLIEIRVLSGAYHQQLYRTVSGNLSFSAGIISERLKNLETLSSIAISSSAIQSSLDTIDHTESPILHSSHKRIINNTLSNYQQSASYRDIIGICLYNRHFANSTNLTLLKPEKPELLSTAIEEGREKRGGIAWCFAGADGELLLSRSVLKIENLSLEHLGDLLIYVDLGKIVENANLAVSSYESASYLVIRDGLLLYATPGFDRDAARAVLEGSSDSYSILALNGHQYFTVRNRIPGYPWDYVHLVPYDRIVSGIRATEQTIVLVLLLSLILMSLLLNSLLRYTLNDLDLLILRMDLFSSSSDFTLPESSIDYGERTDELARLHQQFDAMVHQIRHLVETDYINQILNRDARLKALESQINPHFLYNTLETINWRAKALNDSRISMMTESLGNLLRATLSSRKSLVRLSYEMSLVNSYITIQNIRFEDRLRYHSDYEEALGNAMLPPLSIQPLLENAIRYGMEEMTESCEVLLSIQHSGGLLLISVENEGSEFPADLLARLESGEINARGHGIGLVNINQRIQILFGESYGLSFRNENDRAIATITLPYTEEDMPC